MMDRAGIFVSDNSPPAFCCAWASGRDPSFQQAQTPVPRSNVVSTMELKLLLCLLSGCRFGFCEDVESFAALDAAAVFAASDTGFPACAERAERCCAEELFVALLLGEMGCSSAGLAVLRPSGVVLLTSQGEGDLVLLVLVEGWESVGGER